MSEHASEALGERVRAWIVDDPDPQSRDELARLLAANEWDALRERFDSELAFGTAGLRGEMGAGPARINRASVARATAGLCQYLREVIPDACARGLCVGFDGRHMSLQLAEETAQVAAGLGLCVRMFEREVPTPLLAFAVLELGAAAGVMITASHNPARDNGYKVYWQNGAQLLAPHDTAIAARMRALRSLRELVRVEHGERMQRGLQHTLGAELEGRYLAGLRAQGSAAPRAIAAALPIAYSALHGVGERLARTALAESGFTSFTSVPEQADPDPDFPTVAFPNPEEPGAMDRVCALAERTGAALALANDPDADRLAVVARDADGVLRALSGNEVGVLLADARLTADREGGDRFVLSSIVSTPMIARVAQAHGAYWEATLTGFKWICNRALQLERERAARFVFGFEEALGYCIGTRVRDKDGIAAALAVATLAAELRAQGQTLHDRLAALFRAHGAYASAQISLRAEGAEGLKRIAGWMARARERPPRSIAGDVLCARIDLTDGNVLGTPSAAYRLPATDALLWELEGGQRIMLRPSGTEPKLKVYLDACEPVADDEPASAAYARARARLAAWSAAIRARLR